MKHLARANVPTVEAGSFPTSKAPQPPVTQPVSNLLPSDSVSNVGISNTCTSQSITAIEQVMPDIIPTLPSIPHSKPTIATLNGMQPPPPRQAGMKDISLVQSKAFNAVEKQTTGPRTNVSLSTGTTLVAAEGVAIDHSTNAVTRNGSDLTGEVCPDLHVEAQNPCIPRLNGVDNGMILPPRRELPFPKSKPGAQARVLGNSPKQTSTSQHKSEQKAADPAETGQIDSSIKPGRKRPATKATANKRAGPKKPRVATRKNGGKKNNQDEVVVPSVEELLRQPETCLTRRVTRSVSIAISDDFGEEMKSTLAAKKAAPRTARPKKPSSKVPAIVENKRITRSMSIAEPDNISSLEIPETITEQGVPGMFPCTPADQMIKTNTPQSPHMGHRSFSPKRADIGQA